MTVKQLKKLIANLSDASEIVVHADSNSRDYLVSYMQPQPSATRYFGGDELDTTEPYCLVLYVD